MERSEKNTLSFLIHVIRKSCTKDLSAFVFSMSLLGESRFGPRALSVEVVDKGFLHCHCYCPQLVVCEGLCNMDFG